MTGQPYQAIIDKLGRGSRRRLEEVLRAAVPATAPAVALSVWHAGAPWYEAYAGWTDPDTREIPAGFGSLFDLASLTKLVTATAFLRLASDVRVDLDDAVVSLIPEFGASGPRGVDGGQEPLSRRPLPVPRERAGWTVDPSSVTFRQLLTHTGGLAPWRSLFRQTGPVPPPPDGLDPVPLEERWRAGVDAIGGFRFVARPGEEVHYSDLGYILLGVAVARRFGQPLSVALQALVRDRLGLDSLTFTPLQHGRPRARIVPTSIDADWRMRRCWGEAEDENAAGLGGVAGHAGLFATAHDVARFGVAWSRQDPRLRLQRFFRAAVRDQTPGMGAARGYGWQVQPADHLAPLGPGAFGHTGFTGTSLAVDPGRDLVVALLTNRVHGSRTLEGIEQLRVDILGVVADAFPTDDATGHP